MSDNQIRYAIQLDEAMPACAREMQERRIAAGRLMLATEGSYNQSQDSRRHDENDLHRWADDGGPIQ